MVVALRFDDCLDMLPLAPRAQRRPQPPLLHCCVYGTVCVGVEGTAGPVPIPVSKWPGACCTSWAVSLPLLPPPGGPWRSPSVRHMIVFQCLCVHARFPPPQTAFQMCSPPGMTAIPMPLPALPEVRMEETVRVQAGSRQRGPPKPPKRPLPTPPPTYSRAVHLSSRVPAFLLSRPCFDASVCVMLCACVCGCAARVHPGGCMPVAVCRW